MQDRYAGDIGDYVKLGILRALSPGRGLAVAWWLHPDESHNGDGRHVSYLERPEDWREYDPPLFDALRLAVERGIRTVAALESAGVLPGAVFVGDPVPVAGPPAHRAVTRGSWLARLAAQTEASDLLFLDPDNGLEPKRFSLAARRAAKCVGVSELRQLARPGRTIIVYHHQTRRRGGHLAELEHWGERLAAAGFTQIDAIRARPYSARAFFLLDADSDTRSRAAKLAQDWIGVLSWHPDLQGRS